MQFSTNHLNRLNPLIVYPRPSASLTVSPIPAGLRTVRMVMASDGGFFGVRYLTEE